MTTGPRFFHQVRVRSKGRLELGGRLLAQSGPPLKRAPRWPQNRNGNIPDPFQGRGGSVPCGGDRLDFDNKTGASKARDVENGPRRERLGDILTFDFSELRQMRTKSHMIGDELDEVGHLAA